MIILAAILGGDAWAAFPGANGRIAFSTNRDGGNFEVYVMNADGSGQTRLTDNAASDVLPAFSPDGTRIAFRSNRDGNSEIYVMNADGSGQTNLTNNSAIDGDPAFSPDGSRMAFSSNRDGNNEVYVMNADGSGQTNLTNNPASDITPAFSPDGSRIAFRSGRDGNDEIYVMNADGSGQTRLTNNSQLDELPDFSPDGSRIAFRSERRLTAALARSDSAHVRRRGARWQRAGRGAPEETVARWHHRHLRAERGRHGAVRGRACPSRQTCGRPVREAAQAQPSGAQVHPVCAGSRRIQRCGCSRPGPLPFHGETAKAEAREGAVPFSGRCPRQP